MDDLRELESENRGAGEDELQGIDVYKLTAWTQGQQCCKSLQHPRKRRREIDGYNSSRYINTIYQTMSLAFADRDFYYGDSRDVPVRGLLSKITRKSGRS